MKKITFLMANAMVIALAAFLLPMRCGAASSNEPWQIETRPFRISLDWRSDDRRNLAEPTEVFFDLGKLASTVGAGNLAPESFTFVAENSDGTFEPMAVATREELGRFGREGTVFRFVPPPLAKQLWMYFGGTDHGAATLSTQWNLLTGAFDSAQAWDISDPRVSATIVDRGGEHAMQLAYDDKGHQANSSTRAMISRSFPVPPDCRGVEAKVAFDLKGTCENHVPLTILLEQFDQAGKQLDACAVDPRWLSMCLASGEDIQLREQGFIYPATASIKMVIGLWCAQKRDPIMNADGTWMQYPGSDNFQVQITRAEMRGAHSIAFPGLERSNYAPGITGNQDDLSLALGEGVGFCYDANPRTVWSEGALPSNPREYGWPCGAGTFECWVLPQWDMQDSGKRYVLNAMASYGAGDSVLEMYYVPNRQEFHIVRADFSEHKTEQVATSPLPPGQWHHLAYTWDPTAKHQELFVDGQSVMSRAADPIESIDVTDLDSSKMIPGRVWLGQSQMQSPRKDESLHGRMDEVRVSDGIRYSAAFAPQRTPFVVDESTRALFHFDGRTQGLIANDRGYIEGTLLSPAPQTSDTLGFERHGDQQIVQRDWSDENVPDALNPHKLFPMNGFRPLTRDEFTNSSLDKQAVLHLKPGESAEINCASEPHMDWVEIRCPEGGTTLTRPFLAKPNEVDPRTLQSVLASLKIASLPTARERADAIFKYLVGHNDYFWSTAEDIQPSGEIVAPGQFATLYLNGYPQFGCGEENRMVRDFFLAAGLSSDMTHGSQHVFEQVFFDGSWHIYDLFARMFFPARDNQRPAGVSEVERDPYLPKRMDSPGVGFWLPSDTRIYQFPDREIALPDMGYRLRPGEAIRYYWHNDGRYNPILANPTDHSTPWDDGPKVRGRALNWANHFPPYTANGVFSFACTPREDHPTLSDWHDGSFVYRFLSPYVVCGAAVNVSSDRGSAPTLEVSYDEGSSWIPVPAAADDGTVDLDRMCMARHLYWIRVTPPQGGNARHFEHRAIVLMNPKVLTPVLGKGDNTLGFTAEAGSAADVTIQYHEESDEPLEIEGGARFGWVNGYPRQLLVCQPGGRITFHVRQDGSTLSVIAPRGATTTTERAGDSEWRVDVDVPSLVADGLYPLIVKAGGRSRTAALLVAKHARMVSPLEAAKRGDATITDDPEGIRGPVLSLNAGAETDFPLGDDGGGPLALFALAKIPDDAAHATLMLPSGPAPFIEANYAHEYWVQTNLLYFWKWYHVRAGEYPWPTLAAVNLADPHSANINCTEGQTSIGALLVLPAQDERLVEAVTHYLFSGDYDPGEFEHDWGPVVTGVAYPLKR